jgi:hypothetical protein
MKYIADTPLDYRDELLVTILDELARIDFFTTVAAAALTGDSFRKVEPKAPRPLKRPTMRPKAPEAPKFSSVREVQNLLSKKKVTVHHTEACVASRVNEGGGRLNCSCPRS